jgi:hypothetical protein
MYFTRQVMRRTIITGLLKFDNNAIGSIKSADNRYKRKASFVFSIINSKKSIISKASDVNGVGDFVRFGEGWGSIELNYLAGQK